MEGDVAELRSAAIGGRTAPGLELGGSILVRTDSELEPRRVRMLPTNVTEDG